MHPLADISIVIPVREKVYLLDVKSNRIVLNSISISVIKAMDEFKILPS